MRHLFCLFLIFFSTLCFSQHIRFYNSEHGLLSSNINQLSQDDKGFIWISTENGVYEFDGMSFTTFRHNDTDSCSISNDFAKIVFTDSRGSIWVGTSNGLQIYDRDKNKFTNIDVTQYTKEVNIYISSIVETLDHKNILVSVSGFGLLVFDIDTHQVNESLFNLYNEATNLRFPGVLFIDSRNTLWRFSEQGVFQTINLEHFAVEEPRWADDLKNISSKIIVSSVVEDPITKNILIGTFNDGLFIYDYSLGYVRKPKGLQGKYRIRSLLAEKQSCLNESLQLWVGTEDKGLMLFDRMTETLQKPNFQYTPIDIENCKIHSLLQDNQGNIWAGVMRKGLIVIPRLENRFEYIKLTDQQGSRGTNMACTTSLTADNDGNLWFAGDGAGLFCLNKNGDMQRFSSQNVNLPNDALMAVAADKHGTLWITTYTGGVTKYSKKNGFQTFSTDEKLRKAQCLFYDGNDDIMYFGTLGDGVFALSLSDNILEQKEHISGWITSMYIDSEGLLWVGNTEGLSCFNPTTQKKLYVNVTDSLKNIKIYSTLEDKMHSDIWFATQSGLICWHKTTGEIERFTTQDGLSDNTLLSMLIDSDYRLWLGSGNGLTLFDPNTRNTRTFFVNDGIQDNEFHTRCCYQAPDGKLYFGGLNGVTAFYPKNIQQHDPFNAPLYFSKLSVLNKNIEYDENNSKNILDSHISQASQITLDYTDNVFTLDFGVLEYTNPTNITYAYRLEGFDSDWRFATQNNRSATYTNLHWGKYKFVVKAFKNGYFDELSCPTKSIDILILPPWYHTGFAYLIYHVIFALLILRLVIMIRRRKHRINEAIESDKKEAKLKLFTDMSHEIRTPLSLVISPLKNMCEIETDPKRRDMLDLMYRNAQRVIRLLNQLIDLRKFDNKQLKMKYQRIEIFDFMQDIMKSFDQLALVRNIDLRIVSTLSSLMVWIDAENFDKVIFNILSNAFKFTPDNGTIMIIIDSFTQKNDKKFCQMTIENSGSHIDEKEFEHIFDRFYQSKNNKLSGGSGIGLNLSKMIVEALHGTISAHNVDGGVAFDIRLPLGREHITDDEIISSNNTIKPFSIDDSSYVEIPQTDISDDIQTSSRSKMKTIVFIDDDDEWTTFIKNSLSDSFNVEICSTPSEAWHLIQTALPDAVVTDLIMPDVDGIEIIQRMRQSPELSHLPIIILTSENDEETEQKCISAGADNFLTKPISINLLRTTIAHEIATREMLRNKYRADAKTDFDAVEITSPDSRLIAKVIEAIRNNLENSNYGVDDLSREVGISRVHLNRKLKETLNTSPSNLIKSIRLKQAAYLLINNKLNVSEVAYKIGYSSHSYFSNSFKDYFGLSPTDFVIKYSGEDKENFCKLFGLEDESC